VDCFSDKEFRSVHSETERLSVSNKADARARPGHDPRAIKTRAALTRALIELMAERGWERIAVRDICARAEVARSTFYLHYSGRMALLEGGLKDLEAQLSAGAPRAYRVPVKGWKGFSFLHGLVEHVRENKRIFRSVVGKGSSHAVHVRFRTMVVRLIEHELPISEGSPLPEAARARCLAALLGRARRDQYRGAGRHVQWPCRCDFKSGMMLPHLSCVCSRTRAGREVLELFAVVVRFDTCQRRDPERVGCRADVYPGHDAANRRIPGSRAYPVQPVRPASASCQRR
jgi:AcrR family transcriptional regulator